MMIRRIFAGSIVALMLSASSLAVACDVSCALGSMTSDCHSGQIESQDLTTGDTKMGGMVMDGMTMPETVNSGGQSAVSGSSQAKANHPSIGEMGPCEKQACDNGSAVSTNAARSANSHFPSGLVVIEIPRAKSALKLLRDARVDIATNQVRRESLLRLSLRI